MIQPRPAPENPDIQRLLDYVSRAGISYGKSDGCSVLLVDRYGHSFLSHSGAKPDKERLDDLFRQARRSDQPILRSRGDRHLAAVPFRVRNTFQGLFYLEGGCPFTPDQLEMANHLIDFASLSIENSFLRTRMLTDQLTGLFNSNYVKDTLDREIRMARGLDKKVALLLIDIDNFGEVNNSRGTATGDAILVATGERLAQELKSILGVTAHRVNVWLEGQVGRYGGDEFAFLLFDAGQKVAAEVSEKILTTFRERPLNLAESATPIPITVSIGGAVFPDDATTAEKLFVKAYYALYTAKTSGKDQAWLCSQAQEPIDVATVKGLAPKAHAALSVILRTMTEDEPLDHILGRSLSHIMKETRADRGRIVLIDEQGQSAATASAGWTGDPRAPAIQARSLTASLIRLPLESGGRAVGEIEIESTARGFTEADHDLLQTLAPRAGVALERTRRLQLATLQLKKLEATLKTGLKELSERYAFQNIIGSSRAMMEVFGLMEKVCGVDYPVIIEGETGTGKELVAKSIHFNSRRKDRPFIPINCAAISETILESELFGHVKGAFTGADDYKAGLFELASGGTLFLDEIEEMSQTLQRKLLRALEDRNIRPVGSRDVVPVDVRVIASTNRRVKEMLEKDQLREDLFYRLATFIIYLPPLRERAEDIPQICEHLLGEIARELNVPRKSLDPDALRVLMKHPWPGNVRELRNELRKAFVLSPSDRISPQHFSPHVNPSEMTPAYEGDYAKAIQQFERSMILQALEHHRGNLTRAAEALEMARNTLKAKIKQYRIELPKSSL